MFNHRLSFFRRCGRRCIFIINQVRLSNSGTFCERPVTECCALYSPHRDYEPVKGDHVKHYKIKTLDNGGYFVTTRKTFQTLQDLVAHYSEGSNGLCHQLTKPCAKKKPDYWPNKKDEIDRRDLEFIKELGGGNFGKVYYGLYKGNVEVAIKTLKTGTMSPQAFLEEAAIMRKCRHDKLVPLYGTCTRARVVGQPHTNESAVVSFSSRHAVQVSARRTSRC